MEYGLDRIIGSQNQYDDISVTYTNLPQLGFPNFDLETCQNIEYYGQEPHPYVVETVSDCAVEQPTIYHSGSTSEYSGYSPQQTEVQYTADQELDNLLQQGQDFQSGAYTMDCDLLDAFQPQMQKVEPKEQLFGAVLPEDDDLEIILDTVLSNEDLNAPLPELSTRENILEDIKNLAMLPQREILEQYGAAVVSPLDSGSSASDYNDIPVTVPLGEASPTSFQELFDSVAFDETSSDAAEAQPQVESQVFMYVDENGVLQRCDPPAPSVPAAVPSKPVRKRGRKPLPKPPVTDSEFFCLPCNKVFKRHRGLLQHNHYHHSGPKEHSCTQCGKKYPTAERLQVHLQKHDNAFKPYACQFCPKRFSHPHDMKRHIWTSHGEAPFSCSFCDKRFGRLDHVEQHEISHKNNTVIVKK